MQVCSPARDPIWKAMTPHERCRKNRCAANIASSFERKEGGAPNHVAIIMTETTVGLNGAA